MKTVSLSEFRSMRVADIKENLPLQITAESEILGTFGKADGFIYIGDMHPRVQNQFKNREQLVRQGMPR